MPQKEDWKPTNVVIARNARIPSIDCLRDRDNPLRFRYLTDRTRGRWDLYYKGVWHPFGRWPALDYATALERLPGAMELKANGGKTVRAVGALLTVGQLLNWYQDRQLHRRDLSHDRRAGIKSIVSTWLYPRLCDARVGDLDRALLSRQLIQPMGITCMPSYIRQAFATLKAAYRAALGLGLVLENPLEVITFKSFGLSKIRPKAARLRAGQLQWLAELIFARLKTDPTVGMLALVMLCFGTRLGETRQLRWADFKVDEGLLVIPAERTKTRVQLELPLSEPFLILLEWYRAISASRPSVYLFPGVGRNPLGSVEASRIFQDLSGGDWSSHDIRKLVRGCWQLLDVNHLVAESLLNHAFDVLSATYVQERFAQKKRLALELWHGAGTEDLEGLRLDERLRLLLCNDDKS